MSAPDPYRLAASLGRPLARGWLSPAHVHAALTVAAHRSGADIEAALPVLWHVVGLHHARLEAARTTAAGAVRHRLWPLLQSGAPSNAIRAEAHNVNGSRGFPLDENEVETIIRAEIAAAIRRRQGGRHG